MFQLFQTLRKHLPIFAFVVSAVVAVAAPVQWRGISHIQSATGITDYTWDNDCLCFSNKNSSLRFFHGRRRAEINGTTVWLNAQPDGTIASGNWRLANLDLDHLSLSILPAPDASRPRPLRVMLDPGHGGSDEGARSDSPLIREKDLTLILARKTAAHLKKAGLHVELTRTADTTLALADRSRLARLKKSDLFISIHLNKAANGDASGIETYILPPSGYPGTAENSKPRGWHAGNRHDYHNTALGYQLHRHLTTARPAAPDRGLKRQAFHVLREAPCPAALVELGFLSNKTEAHLMTTEKWQNQAARATADGILAYARRLETLDRAIAQKRARDEEANERWRRHLAAQKSSPAATPTPSKPTSGIPSAASSSSRPAAETPQLAAAALPKLPPRPTIPLNPDPPPPAATPPAPSASPAAPALALPPRPTIPIDPNAPVQTLLHFYTADTTKE